MIDYNTLDKSKTYIAFSSGNTWISKIIKWFTKSRYSHSFVLFWSPRWNAWLAIGEDWNGFCMTPAKTENTLAIAEFTKIDLKKGLRINVDELGTGYGYGTLLGMIWVEIGRHIFHREWKNPIVSKTNWICSEICTHIIKDSGEKLGLIPSTTDPGFLIKYLKTWPDVIITEM